MIFGRTDLRISLSGAKFDAEADFDVRFAAARPNPRQISEKQNFRSEIFAQNFFLALKNKTARRRHIIWLVFERPARLTTRWRMGSPTRCWLGVHGHSGALAHNAAKCVT